MSKNKTPGTLQSLFSSQWPGRRGSFQAIGIDRIQISTWPIWTLHPFGRHLHLTPFHKHAENVQTKQQRFKAD